MKYNEFQSLINSAIQRDGEGKITGIDSGSIINAVNGHFTEVIKGKEESFKGSLEDVKKGAINDFLKESGFDSKKTFTSYLEESKGYKTNYEKLQGEVKESTLNSKINEALRDLKVEEKYSATVGKLLNRDGLYGEDGALKEDVLKESVTSIIKDDLMLSYSPKKVGIDPDKTKKEEEAETRRKKF